MAREITARETNRICGKIRRELGDLEYKLFTTEEDIFDKVNDIISKICKETYCLDDLDIVWGLEPNTSEYKYVDVADSVQAILRINEFYIIDPQGAESYPLTKVSTEEYQSYRRDTSISSSKYFNFDEHRIYYCKPVSSAGYKGKIKCARLPKQDELVYYDKDPVIPIKYSEYVVYGALWLLASMYPDKFGSARIEAFGRMFGDYKTTQSKTKVLTKTFQEFNELR